MADEHDDIPPADSETDEISPESASEPRELTPPAMEVTCLNCGTLFEPTLKTSDHPGYCTRKCLRKAHSAGTARRVSVLPRALLTDAPFTPQEASALRSRMAHYVARQIELANEFVLGVPGRKMSAQQVRVFVSMLNKVIPDLNHTFIKQNTSVASSDMATLTREELEDLALRASASSSLARVVEDSRSYRPDPALNGESPPHYRPMRQVDLLPPDDPMHEHLDAVERVGPRRSPSGPGLTSRPLHLDEDDD